MRIAIDIDSTLHHYWDVLSEAARRRFGVELPYAVQSTWSITRLRPEQLAVCIAETHSDPVILAAEPYPHAVETVNGWHDAGHAIHIVSHRDPRAHDATAAWLQRIGVPHGLHCGGDKVAYCLERGVDVLIDDSPDHIRAAVEARIVPATIAHPWNRDVCAEEGVRCAPDWPALARVLAAVLAAPRAATA